MRKDTSTLKDIVGANLPFFAYLLFSLICVIVFASISIDLKGQKDNPNLLSLQVTEVRKYKNGDIDNTYIDKEQPNSIVFNIRGVSHYKNYISNIELEKASLNVNGNYIASFSYPSVASILDNNSNYFNLSFTMYKGDYHFNEVWNSGSSYNSSIKVEKVKSNIGEPNNLTSWAYWISRVVTWCFSSFMIGVLLVGIVALMAVGYLNLPVFVRLILWVLFFPIMIILFGFIGGVAMGGEKVYDKDGNVQGYYDSKTNTYRDKHGRIRDINWWLNKNEK